MSDIVISKPFTIEFNILEFDNRQLSVNVLFKCSIDSLYGKFIELNNRVWIDCQIWDMFTVDLNAVNNQTADSAKLFSLSDEQLLEITAAENGANLYINCNKLLNTRINIDGVIRVAIDYDELAQLNGQFTSFPKWW